MTAFWIALQFLTTFPVQLKAMPTPQQNGQSLLFYTVVGLMIGVILFAIASVLHAVPIVLLSSVIWVIWIWLTGGLHLDGLADTADAWVGGFGDAERTLKIMKDPACGPIGVLSLIIICILKWSAIYLLLQKQMYIALLLFPVLGRVAPLILFLTALLGMRAILRRSKRALIGKVHIGECYLCLLSIWRSHSIPAIRI